MARVPKPVSTDQAPPLGPPGPFTTLGEATSMLEFGRLGAQAISLARTPRGSGEPVRVLPGFGASDPSTFALRRFLISRGYAAQGWGLGRNAGDVRALGDQVVQQAERDVDQAGERLHLIGWSLGGVIAREIARERPDLIAQVITFGSPIIGGPRHTTLARLYGADRIQAIEAAIGTAERTPITVPVTAIYSRRDGIVNWRACVDTVTPGAVNVEVRSTHLGMGVDPDVWRTVIERLAAYRRNTA